MVHACDMWEFGTIHTSAVRFVLPRHADGTGRAPSSLLVPPSCNPSWVQQVGLVPCPRCYVAHASLD